MAISSTGRIVLGLLLLGGLLVSPVQAQDRVARDPTGPSAVGQDYASQCWRHGLRCALVYGQSDQPEPTSDRSAFTPRMPMIDGSWGIVVVLPGLLLAIGLWLRFAGGGVLLSSKPRELKKSRDTAPESWKAAMPDAQERPDQFLQRIAALGDRRQALIQLLRRCLMHAADITETRLFRYDTERAVLARLPADGPGWKQLEALLSETELVHYGGRVLPEDRFAALLDTARLLLRLKQPNA